MVPARMPFLRSCIFLAVVSCVGPGPDLGVTEDDVCTYDCPICAPGEPCGPCVQTCYTCPAVAPPPPTIGVLPPSVSTWDGAWLCERGCDLPAHLLVQTTRVVINTNGIDNAAWRQNGMTKVKTEIVRDGVNCWQMPADDFDGCRGAIDICGVSNCADVTPQADCVRATATWTELLSGRRQVWRFIGVQ